LTPIRRHTRSASPSLIDRLLSLHISALLPLALFLIVGCSGGSGDSAKPSSDSKASAGGDKSSSNASSAPNTVQVPLDQQPTIGIRVVQVEPTTVPRTLTVPAQVMMDEERTAHIAPYSDGRVVDIEHNVGDLVARGTVLAHLHSHSVHETVGALAQNFANLARAQAAVLYAQQKRDRYAHLYSIQAASLEQQQMSDQELVQAKTDAANAQAAVTMEREHLADLLEIPPASITPATLYTYENVPIVSPIAGTIISRTITPGMVLEPGNEAYTVSNLNEVWVVAAVSEADLSHVHMGQRLLVHSPAWPNETFAGHVTLIGSSLDPATRTVQVRASLVNPQARLKPQMFVSSTLDENATRPALFVPEDALQEVKGVQVVFITTDGTHFVPRALKTLPAVNGQVEVTAGLQAGDHVAVGGAFMLKADLLKGSLDEE
jgi:cobalt-zinc-cadmium efflux system membrane fusion protein